jgi:HPt (histidine-containing phosphotransfer) domain-containing protein
MDNLIDVNDALARLGNNKKLYGMLLKKFDGNAMLDDLTSKLANGDTAGAQAQAHTIKGLAANLSLQDLRFKAEAIEQKLKDGGTAAEIDPAEIIASTKATVNAVKEWLSENS